MTCWLAAAVACSEYDTGLLPEGPGGIAGNLAGDGGAPIAGDGAGSDGGVCGQPDDPDNCGSCGVVCEADHGEAACARGMCWVAACDPGFANCDEDQASCETSTRQLATCGGCNSPCLELPNAVPSCDDGTCAVARCEPGFGDCDERADNGCETSLGSLEHCGGCDVPCELNSCAGGICTAAECDEGEGDCDGDGASCETDLFDDPDNCGECGASCSFADGVTPNGELACSPEGCAVACDDGFADCDGDYTTGCEAAGVDTDDDGFADCVDGCPDDPEKQQAGECGCGNADSDGDDDGTPDCDDLCPLDGTRDTECLGFAPANFDPRPIDWSAQRSSRLDCGTSTIDTTDPDGTGPEVATISDWCGEAPTPIAQDQGGGGPQLVILTLQGLSIPSGNTLRVVGARPLVIAVDGDVSIAGTIDANASGTTPGAGGNVACGTSAGGNGSGDTGRFDGASGGGGGGFGTAGGRAGVADTDGSDTNGGIAGVTRGNTDLVPLLGGCGGGRAGDCSTNGGAGGGALQITASGSITVSGTLRANGAAGATPCGQNDEGGGTGGGSGGALLLEATDISTSGATLQTHGGNGGRNGNYAGIYDCGGTNGGAGSTSASSNGGNGGNCQGGSPGGGGGYGRQRVLEHAD